MKKNYFRAIMLIILIISIGKITINALQKKNDKKNFEELTEIIETKKENPFKLLEEKNNNFKAWIKINGTHINYPVMQTKNDEEYYLHRNFYNKYSPSGTPFLKKDSIINTNSQAIIYGHNMSDKTMFSDLLLYEDKEFYEKNKTIELYTSKEKLIYEIFAVVKVNAAIGIKHYEFYNVNNFSNEKKYNNFINETKKESLYKIDKTPKFGNQILTLVTCDRIGGTNRIVVFASAINKE